MAIRVPSGEISRIFWASLARSSIRLWTKKICPPRPRSRRIASPSRSRSNRQTMVRIASRSAGGVAMIEISRSPPIAICKVRGIGVAVSVSTSTCVRSSLRRSLWVTPNRCSSSTTSSPRSWKRTSRDRSRCVPTTTSSFPSASAAKRRLLLGLGPEARHHRHPHRKIAEALGEGEEVLLGQDRGRRQHRRLLAAQHRHQRRAQRHLGLAVADVAADEAIHRHPVLHVGQDRLDGLLLIRRLVEGEGLLERPEHRVRRREGVPGQRRPLRVELHQLLGDLARLRRHPASLLLPGPGPQLVEPHGIGLAARIPVDQADAIDGQVDRAAVVLELQEVLRNAAHGELLEPAVAADPMLVVDDEIALRDLAEVTETGRLRRRPGLARGARAEDLLLGDDDQTIGRQREPAPERPDQHRQRASRRRGEQIPCLASA